RRRRLLSHRLSYPPRCEVILVAVAAIVLGSIRRGLPLQRPVVPRGQRATTSHSSDPTRFRPRRVSTRRLTIPMPTSPFSPSHIGNRAPPSEARDGRQARTDCEGVFGGRPRPWYAGNGARRSRIVVVQGPPVHNRWC